MRDVAQCIFIACVKLYWPLLRAFFAAHAKLIVLQTVINLENDTLDSIMSFYQHLHGAYFVKGMLAKWHEDKRRLIQEHEHAESWTLHYRISTKKSKKRNGNIHRHG